MPSPPGDARPAVSDMEIILQLLDDVDDAVITLAYSRRARVRFLSLAALMLSAAALVAMLWP